MAETSTDCSPGSGAAASGGHREVFALLDRVATRSGGGVDRVDDPADGVLAKAARTLEDLVDQLGRLPDGLQLAEWSRVEQMASAQRLAITARMTGSTGDRRVDERRARNALGASGSCGSSRSRNRDAKRAASVAANPVLGDRLADGTITPDAVDHLLKTADGNTGAIPVELIDTAGGLTADQTAQVVERFVADRVDVDEVRERFRRQNEARTVRRYRAGPGGVLAGLSVEGPDAVVDAMWAHVNARADSVYRAAGGRDRPVGEHVSLDHRRFDAVWAALTGEPAGLTGSGGDRATVVVTVDAAELFDSPDDPAVAAQLGTGPIPDELFERYVRAGPLAVLVTGVDGVPLWLGRARRHGSNHQFLALAVRDRGCVLCRAPIDRCVAHHVMPWSAPGRGRTDVDQLALLCQRCHGDLHHRNHTLTRRNARDGTRIWATRPATPDETPAPAPKHRQLE